MSLNTHISSPFVKRNYNSSTCLSHEKTCGEMKDRGKRRAGKMVPKGATRREGGKEEGEGQSRKRGKWKMHFFFSLSLVHMRAQLCVFAFSLPNLFYPMEIRHPSECVCVYVRVYSSSVLR